MNSDRITEERDWQDGINIFRLRILDEVKEINKKIKELQQQVKGETP